MTIPQSRERSITTSARDVSGAATLMFPRQSSLIGMSGPGYLCVDVLRVKGMQLAIGQVVSTGHEVEVTDEDGITLLVPISGRIDMAIRDGQHRIATGGMGVALEGTRRTRVVAPRGGRFRAATLQLPSARLLSSRDDGRRPGAWNTPQGILFPHQMLARHVACILPQLAEDLFRQPDRVLPERVLLEVNALIDDLLCDISTGGIDWSGPLPSFRDFRRVCQAIDIIQSCSADPLSITTLAGQLDITPRSLQLAFQSVHGMTPRQYLERVRLDRAHQRLLVSRGTESITTIAFDCGFTHLGRFTQAYRRAFRERPSETMARSRG